ncbi:MAG: hypothetical protein QOI49_504 [Verrucomicrobiota bacterium]
MSDGSDVCGCGTRGDGRGAGRGTAEASATGGRVDSTGACELDGFKPSSLDFDGVAEGLGDLAGSVLSVRLGFGVSFSDSVFFFGVGDLSASALGLFLLAGVSLALAFGFGVTSSSSSPDFLLGDFDAFGFGVGDVSSSSPFAGVFFGFGFGVGVGVAFFFVFDFRFAGFGFAVGSGVSDGVGEVTARISSRAFFFFSGSVDWAWTNAPRIAASVKTVPRKTRSRITGRERNRGEGAIKRAVGPLRARWPRARVRGAKSHSVFRRATRAGTSGTSTSSTR